MSSNCYLVARDVKTNDFEMMKKFSSLREADLYTTNYHNSKDLAKHIWKSNIVPKQDIDFFIVIPKSKDHKEMQMSSVLYSNSKEIRMIDNEEIKENTLKHFYKKIEEATEFLNAISEEHPELYAKVKNYFLEDEDKDISYKMVREAILSFAEYKNNNKESNNLYRLVLERKIANLFDDNYNENQLSFLEEQEEDNTCKIVETLELLKKFDKSILDIKDGVVYTTNNIYTREEDLEKLDSLLDQRIGFIMHDYLNENDHELNERRELKIIEILSSDKKVLNDTYKYARNINTNIQELLGDNNGYQYKRTK